MWTRITPNTDTYLETYLESYLETTEISHLDVLQGSEYVILCIH